MTDRLQADSFNYKVNNLNLIRLFAAIQVVVGHLQFLFGVPDKFEHTYMFNGVPIFFVISGFLIYWSYDNNTNILNYARNRFLRIYPGLLCSFIFTIILLLSFGRLAFFELFNFSFFLWIFAQLTFFQQFTPSVVPGFGGFGIPNLALWTISVEILFYISIPLVYRLLKRCSLRYKTLIIISLGILSYLENTTAATHSFLESLSNNGYFRIFIVPFMQFFAYFFYFCFGIVVYLHKDKIIPFLANKCILFIGIYIFYCIILYNFGYHPGAYHPNIIELLGHGLLVLSIFSCAYTKPNFANKLIGKTDISYGVYIYHFLIINSFNELSWNSYWCAIPLIVVCFLFGYFSWKLVEKPALKLKKRSLYKI